MVTVASVVSSEIDAGMDAMTIASAGRSLAGAAAAAIPGMAASNRLAAITDAIRRRDRDEPCGMRAAVKRVIWTLPSWQPGLPGHETRGG